MKKIDMKLKEKGMSVFKLTFSMLCVLFGIATLVLVLVQKDYVHVKHCLAEMLLVLLPIIVSLLMRFRMSNFMYVFIGMYAVAPLVGEVYNFYYIFSWWDDVLHFTGGVVFAMFGVFLFKYMVREQPTALFACAVFALCFSISISAVWELYEFGNDALFDTDMQKDTVISSFNSTLIADNYGDIVNVDGIDKVTIGGDELWSGGYLDIGLIDSMKDMAVESLGALLYVAIFLMDKDRHSIFVSLKNDKN